MVWAWQLSVAGLAEQLAVAVILSHGDAQHSVTHSPEAFVCHV